MKLIHAQLRQHHLQLRSLLIEVGDALHKPGAPDLWRKVKRLYSTALGHLEFHRGALLPALASSQEELENPVMAGRTRALVGDLEMIARALRSLLEPHTAPPLDVPRLRQEWPGIRDVLETLVAEESELIAQPPDLSDERDRRITPRANCECQGALLGPPPPARVKVQDLSLGGMFVQMAPPLPRVGTYLDLEVCLPGLAVPLKVSAEVRRQRPDRPPGGNGGIGTRFVGLGATTGLVIATYLAALQMQQCQPGTLRH